MGLGEGRDSMLMNKRSSALHLEFGQAAVVFFLLLDVLDFRISLVKFV